MAKPIGNDKGGKSQSFERSHLVDSTNPFSGSDSNDFFYIDPDVEWDYGWDGEIPEAFTGTLEEYLLEEELILPDINGLDGADQIIMMEDANIKDGFFALMENVTVLKLGDGKNEEDGYDPNGSTVELGELAFAAGIREVTGGPADDVIDFSGYDLEALDTKGLLPEEYDPEDTPIEIIIRGGAGADEMTASDFSDTFFWKAGDMEGTDDENFDTIYGFDVNYDTLDIAGLLAGFVADGYEFVEWSIENDDTHTTLYIDLDGEGEDFGSEALVLLVGVALSGDVTVVDTI